MTNPTTTDYKTRHNQVLRDMIEETDIPSSSIKEAMLYALFPGGKRLRPMLVYLCGELTTLSLASLDVMAAAIEMIHGYSLIHDDLPAMDNDDYRRGRLTCHKAFDEATAILVGDGLQALAIDILLTHLPKTLTSAQVVAVTQALVQACGPSGMVSGQSLDLSLLQQAHIQETSLQMIHQLKTGKLILACINMVIAASHMPFVEAEALRQFANHLGLLFQMQDDYLDRYAQPEVLGKGRSSDLANQKQTFATLYDEPTLADLIMQHITKAHQSLAIFKERAEALQALLATVKNRM